MFSPIYKCLKGSHVFWLWPQALSLAHTLSLCRLFSSSRPFQRRFAFVFGIKGFFFFFTGGFIILTFITDTPSLSVSLKITVLSLSSTSSSSTNSLPTSSSSSSSFSSASEESLSASCSSRALSKAWMGSCRCHHMYPVSVFQQLFFDGIVKLSSY